VAKKPEDITVDDLRYLANDSFLMWALTSGAKVDSNEIDFEDHRYLLPIYMDDSREIVWQKAAQLGATVYMLLRALWWLEKHQGRKAGLYFPTKEGVENLSKDRLTPLIDSCPSIKKISTDGDKLGLRKIGKSSFYLYHLGGQATKDSVPLDFISFDEVRLCDPKDIAQALHRISHSYMKGYGFQTFMSTCGLPDTDINEQFNRGTQHIWMSKCGCPDGCDLARTFPDCVVADDPRREIPYLRCPKCRYEIIAPQNGRYVPRNPGASYNSYHASQLVSKGRPLEKVWSEYTTTINMEEFYNSSLGIPFIDAANRGVTPSMLEEAINPELKWMKDEVKVRGSGARTRTAMGIDQGGAYNMVVIADINPDGTKKRVRHVEIIDMHNPDYYSQGRQVSPFERCHELMDEFNVNICVVDMMPNYNDALKFAQTFPGKVFLAIYSYESKEVVQWGDRGKMKETVRKAGPLLRFKYQCSIGRFPSLSYSLGEWAEGNVEIPPLDGLRQMARQEKTSLLVPEAPARRLFNHLPRLIKKWKETDVESGRGRWDWIYAGGDPHLAHAWNYCNVALERLKRKTIFTFG
jgi:hypothetical protein